ncbi:MAG: MBL fold metallo-hydrolase [Flavobacteriia bacterium]|nr:MBL fold metallo-hydrolase [Flavobacteriia bacterium]
MTKQFGGKITSEELSKYEASPNWKNGSFKNLETTTMSISMSQVPGMIAKQIRGTKPSTPEKPLPVIPFDKEAFLEDSDDPKFIWYGHSVLLVRWRGKTMLIDPMLGPSAAPIAPGGVKRFSKNTLSLIDEFPEIDLVLITHDHYDHLDLASIMKLSGKVKAFYVALGVKRHLLRWGIDDDKITEFDWWDSSTFNGIDITFTPTRHFSGRGLKDRAKSLWGGWAFVGPKFKVWFSGDGGYGKHFRTIGEKLGPFDLSFMECGQYSPDWHLIHMFPDESVQAAMDVGTTTAIPVHWAAFKLSYAHAWYQPMEEFIEHSDPLSLIVGTPAIGELFSLGDIPTERWWEK